MIFQDTIGIKAQASKIFSFFENMDQHYLLWHPDHKLFKWIKGKELKVGNRFYFEEVIGGALLKKEVLLTKISPYSYIEFRPTFWLMRLFLTKMTFIITDKGDYCEFTGQIFLKGFGPLAKRLHRKQFEAIRLHMKEEGENLKRIMEL